MQLIDKDALVAEIERQISAIDNCPKITNTQISVLEGNKVVLTKLLSFINTVEVKEVDNIPNIRFPHYKSIVQKVFGAGNLESFEYDEAEQLVLLAKEELLKDLEVKEVELDEEIKSYFKGFGKYPSIGIDDCIDIAKHFFELGIAVSNKTQKEE